MTRDQLQQYVQARVTIWDDGADTVDGSLEQMVIDSLIAELNAQYQQVVLSLQLEISRAEIFSTADSADLTLPVDCGEILRIRQGDSPLEPVTWQEFVDREAVLAAGSQPGDLPAFFVQRGESTITVFPSPTDVLPFQIDYAVQPLPMADGEAVPSMIPEPYQLVIAEYTIEAMYQGEEELAMASAARARGDMLMAKLVQHVDKRQGTRRLQRVVRGGLR